MPSAILYEQREQLPKLGWLARYDVEGGDLRITHGKSVECRERWMAEGVWDGAFREGAFHRRGHLFGTGVRIDDDGVYFVPSSALVDRLLYCWDGDRLLVSNSLVILLAATGAELDPVHDYVEDCKAILAGTEDYDDAFCVRHPRIRAFHQIYFKSIVVRNGQLSLETREELKHFASFAEYRNALSERLEAIVDNGRDPARRTPLRAFGTLSTGYDSSAITSLVKHLGVEQFFTFSGSWAARTEHAAEFDTEPLAQALGIETIVLRRASTDPVDELLLRASSPLGQQLPLLGMARYLEEHCEGAFVFTGFHGDIIWDLNVPESFVTAQIKRHDMSGLDLSELRLKSGFFNVAVPFLFASSIASVVNVSRLKEMEPWKLGNRYDRPISRRLVEEAGVARGLFGVKKAGIFSAASRPSHPQLRKRYVESLRERYGLILPLIYARLIFDRYTLVALARVSKLVSHKPALRFIDDAIKHEFEKLGEGRSRLGGDNFRIVLFRWCVDELTRELGPSLAGEPQVLRDADAAPPASGGNGNGADLPPPSAATAQRRLSIRGRTSPS